MTSARDFSYEGTFGFDATPDELWDSLQRVDLFESWWPWMRDVTVQGEPLTPGSVLDFRIDPPVPYRMTIAVEVTEAEPGVRLSGRVSGDLRGWGHLEFRPDGDGSSVVTTWEVEIDNPAIGAVIRIARPILLWAQRWAVESSLRGFRRYLSEGAR